MKKFFSVFTILLVCFFCFAGCGVNGSTTLSTIKFNKPIYYVDENCAKPLDYKYLPSTANNFNVSYSQSNQDFYEFKNGVFYAQEGFNSVRITIQIGSKQDSCYVVKKIYPTKVFLKHSSLSVNESENANIVMTSNSSTNLQLYGFFSHYFDIDSGIVKKYPETANLALVDNKIFNIKLESSDPTVVSVVDSSTLQIKSTGKIGKSTITAKLLDDSGKQKNVSLIAKLDVNVIDPVEKIEVLYKGQLNTNCLGSFLDNSGASDPQEFIGYIFILDEFNKYVESEVVLRNFKISSLGNEKISNVNLEKVTYKGLECLKFSITLKGKTVTELGDKVVISCKYITDKNNAGFSKVISLS